MVSKTEIEEAVTNVLADAVTRGDCRTYLGFRHDSRWSSLLEETASAETPDGIELRKLDAAYAAMAARETVEGVGSSLDPDHPFNRALAEMGLIELTADGRGGRVGVTSPE